MSRTRVASLLLLALLLPTGAAHAATATRSVVNFDDLKAGTPVGMVDGATFSPGVAVDDGTPTLARSPANVARVCLGQELCAAPFTITFASPQQSVELYVGYAAALDSALPVTLVALDASGTEVGHDDASIAAGPGPFAATTLLAVPANTNSIASVSIDAGGRQDVPGELVVDDVSFSAAVAQPDLSISDPTASESPDDTSFAIRAIVTNTGAAASQAGTITASVPSWSAASTDVPALAPGDHTTIAMTLDIPAGTPAEHTRARLSVAAGRDDANPADNSTDVPLVVQIPSTGGGGGSSSGGGSTAVTQAPDTGPGGHGFWHGYRPIIPLALVGGGALLYRTRRHGRRGEPEVEVDLADWQLKATDEPLPRHCTTGCHTCRKECSIEPHLREVAEVHVRGEGDDTPAVVTGEIVEQLNEARHDARLGRRRAAGTHLRAAAEGLYERLTTGPTRARSGAIVALSVVLEGGEGDCTFTLYRCTGHGETPWDKELTWKAAAKDRATVELGEIERAELSGPDDGVAIAHLQRMLGAIAGDDPAS